MKKSTDMTKAVRKLQNLRTEIGELIPELKSLVEDSTVDERGEFREKVKRKGFQVFDLQNEVHEFHGLLCALCGETARTMRLTGKVPENIARTGEAAVASVQAVLESMDSTAEEDEAR